MEKPEVLGLNALCCLADPATAARIVGPAAAAALMAAACMAPAWVAEGGAGLIL